MSGVKGKSGRKKNTLSVANAKRSMQLLLPRAVRTIGETVEGTNRDRLRYESAKDVYEHCLGKPRQGTDLNIGGGERIGAGTLAELYKAMSDRQRELDAYRGNLLPEGQSTQDLALSGSHEIIGTASNQVIEADYEEE